MKKTIFYFFGLACLLFGVFCMLKLFQFFGPSQSWIMGAQDSSLEIQTFPNASGEFLPYMIEFQRKREKVAKRENISGLSGKVFSELINKEGEIVQTYSGERWGLEQHLFWRKQASEKWKEISIPNNLTIQTQALVTYQGRDTAIVSDWNPWYPYRLSRFFQSIFDKTLRYENGIYLVDLGTSSFTYRFPGDGGRLSPDGTKFLFKRTRDANHEIILWDLKTDTLRTIISLDEADPGSGISFEYMWSDDSMVVRIANMFYFLEKAELFRLQ